MKKNHLSKAVALALAVVLMLALCSTVFAATEADTDTPGYGSDTIVDVAGDDGGMSAQTRYLIVGGVALAICVGFYIVLSIKTKKK